MQCERSGAISHRSGYVSSITALSAQIGYIMQLVFDMYCVWYGMVEFNVPLDTV